LPPHFRMYALTPKADITEGYSHVSFVPCVDGSEFGRRIFTSDAARPTEANHL
jgi:hypothetical protein